MKTKRKYQRFIRRLEIEFSANNQNYRGISSNFSIGGLFIRTNHAFAPGTTVDLLIHLPDNKTAKIKGRVMTAMKTPILSLKNGMGVEIIENDINYINFIKALSPEVFEKTDFESIKTEAEANKRREAGVLDFLIISCPDCGVKNKINKTKTAMRPKCGKCGSQLTINQS